MAATDLPEPSPAFELERFMGTWTILVTNYGFWRERTHPRIEYTRLPGASPRRFSAHLRYRQVGLLGERSKLMSGVEQELRNGDFLWRGDGLLRVIKSRWCVPLVDPDHQWAVTWFARSNVGTAPGLDIYTRAPSIEQKLLDRILEQMVAHPFLGGYEGNQRRCAGLFATAQDWTPPRPYRLKID